ncbi:hypothetical protein [Kitasatospora phosalacinea]|uniref:Uncharacterized protein n=1 Tax=Kitasatospora phosalacinea TaxID=2065 RepID=A0ABW6GKS6_9ACTN
MAAAELSASGEDSPALRDLAGRSGREREAELAALLGRALDELGLPRPESAEAERWAVRELAVRLHAGAADPAGTAAARWEHGNSAEGTAEERFLAALRRPCCGDCLGRPADREPESYRVWAAELRAAAALLAGR